MGVGLLDARKRQNRDSPSHGDDLLVPKCYVVLLSATKSRWPGCETASRSEGRNKAQGAGVDDVDEDMGADNTKRPRRR